MNFYFLTGLFRHYYSSSHECTHCALLRLLRKCDGWFIRRGYFIATGPIPITGTQNYTITTSKHLTTKLRIMHGIHSAFSLNIRNRMHVRYSEMPGRSTLVQHDIVWDYRFATQKILSWLAFIWPNFECPVRDIVNVCRWHNRSLNAAAEKDEIMIVTLGQRCIVLKLILNGKSFFVIQQSSANQPRLDNGIWQCSVLRIAMWRKFLSKPVKQTNPFNKISCVTDVSPGCMTKNDEECIMNKRTLVRYCA